MIGHSLGRMESRNKEVYATLYMQAQYPYPNSGGYIGYIDYILDLYSNVIAIQAKSDCAGPSFTNF